MQNTGEQPKKLIIDKEKARNIVSHTETEIKGFFGEYRFLSNMQRCEVFFDGERYVSDENAYQAAKYPKDKRDYFKTCTPGESKTYAIENQESAEPKETWDTKKVEVMKSLLEQKFDKNINADLHSQLLKTGSKYLEETNYWNDSFWGVFKEKSEDMGEGENNLGKLLMEIRDSVK